MNILTFNSGSSSLKAGIYSVDAGTQKKLTSWGDVATPTVEVAAASAGRAAAQAIAGGLPIDAVGHRVVFGGENDLPAIMTPPLLERLEELTSYDPLHMPSALACLAAARKAFPSLPHVVCFDTMFFRDMPKIARQLPIPTDGDPYLRRYGFHGLSYDYLRTYLGDDIPSRCIFAHLGSGASLAALRDGRPVDTTMGFSSMGGVIMASRPGDIDPGALLYLIQKRDLDVSSLRSILEKRSGLTAISGDEGDLHKLLERHGDDRAVMAIESFVRSVAKAIGGLATVVNGLDLLVFTGGIGEHLAPIRSAIARSLEHLGVDIDEEKNSSAADVISTEFSRVRIRVIPTDENMTIARLSYEITRDQAVNTGT